MTSHTHAREAGTESQAAYQRHPLSAAFPSMPGHEIDALAADIKANGQREPAVIFEGQILDGWHRYRACEIAGVPLAVTAFLADGDPVAFVKSRNLHRRHLTESQRAAAVVACSRWAPTGRPAESAAPAARSPKATPSEEKAEPGAAFSTTAELAREADVSERTIRQAKVAESAGLGGAVREGKVSAKRAAEIVKADPAVGEKIAAGKVTPEEVIENAKPLPKILPRPQREDAPPSAPSATQGGDETRPPSSDPTNVEEPCDLKPQSHQCASCADLRAKLDGLRSDYDELAENRQELADNLEAYMVAGEGAEAVAKEIRSLKEQLRVAHGRRDGLMATNAELVKDVRKWRGRAERAEKKLGKAAAA